MTFPELTKTCEEFRDLLRESTGRDLVASISLDEPIEPQDELHFSKLVSWCYVLLFEASHPAIRYVLSLLRAANPREHQAVSTVFDDVNNLRTVRAHNLSPDNKSDDRKRQQANIWLIQNGGDPPNWPRGCNSLCSEVGSAIRLLSGKWRELIESAEDAAAVVQELLITIDREWPPYIFDRIVEGAATEIGLQGFDYVKYRQFRLSRWRELVGFFETREHAEVAMRAAISSELQQLFGDVASRRGTAG